MYTWNNFAFVSSYCQTLKNWNCHLLFSMVLFGQVSNICYIQRNQYCIKMLEMRWKDKEKCLIHCNKNQLMRIMMHLTNFPSCSPSMFVQLVSHACLQSRSANFCDVDMSSEMCHTSKKGQHFRRFPQGSDEHFDFSLLNFVL